MARSTLPVEIFWHVTLGDLVAFLTAEAEIDPSRKMAMGLSHPHPYRGIHAHKAFEVVYGEQTVSEALEIAKKAIGTTWYDNVYDEKTPVCFASDGFSHGPFPVERNCFGDVDALETAAITGARLRMMMGDEVDEADRALEID